MSFQVRNIRKPLKVDTSRAISISKTSSSSYSQSFRLKLSPSNFSRNMSQTPDITINSSHSNIFTSTTVSPSLSQFSQRHSSMSQSSDSNQSKLSTENSLPKIRGVVTSTGKLEKISTFLQKPDLTQTQKRFFQRNVLVAPEQIKDECKARSEAAYKSVNELSSASLLDKDMLNSHTTKQVTKDIENTIKNADIALGTMGMQVRPCIYPISDSAMTMFPLNEKYELANFYKMFIPEMCRFNYVFLLNLKIGTITVCESVRLTDRKYAPILDQKLHNGLFILESMPDRKSIQKHWFRIILYHFLKATPEFYARWKEMISCSTGRKTKSPLKELVKTFRRLMGVKQDNWREDQEMRTRVKILRESLGDFNLTPTEVTEAGDD